MPKTLISDTIKNVYQKIVFYLTSDSKLYKTTEDGNNDDVEITSIANNIVHSGTNAFTGSTTLSGPLAGSSVLDNDDFSAVSSTKVATSESIKAYVDASVATQASPTITSPSINTSLLMGRNATIEFEGSVADEYETALTVANPTADRILTLPNASDTLVGKETTDILTNKTLRSATIDVSTTLNGAISGTAIDSDLNIVAANTLASAVAIKDLVDGRAPISDIITISGSNNGVKFTGEDAKSGLIFMMLGDLSKYALVYIHFLSGGSTQRMFGSPMSTGISSHSNGAVFSQYIGLTSSDKFFWHRIGGDSDISAVEVELIP